MVFSLHSINVMCYINQLSYVEPSLRFRNKFHLVMMYHPINMNLVCYFVDDFCFSVLKRYWCVVFFFVVSLSDFGIRVLLAS